MTRLHAAPRRLLPALLLFCCAWIALACWLYRTPPIDNVEQLVWREALAWGYYKHPPLPTWLLAAASPAWPATPLLTYVLGAACMGVTLWIYHALLVRLLGRGDALLALLAALCLTYATDRLVVFNHNVVMLPFIAGVLWLLWDTTERPRLAAWAGIGVLLGAGMLTKYQMALMALCVGGWWLRIGGWRDPVHRWGLLLAAASSALMFAPHLLWLAHTDWMTLTYARQSSLGAQLPLAERPIHALRWLGDWMGNRLAPAWVLLFAAAGLLGVSQRRTAARTHRPARLQRDFLLLAGFGPLILMVAMCLHSGAYLQMKWSTAFALWTIPAVQVLLPMRWRYGERPLSRAAWWVFALLQVVLALVLLRSVQVAERDPMAAGGWKQRDFKAMARAIDIPADIVSGPYGMAGMLARSLPGQPRVLIDGDLSKSPWLTLADLQRGRIVSVWATCHPPAGARPLARGWAWWAQPSPPPIPPGGDEQAEIQRRASTQHTGGTATVRCP